MVERLGERGLFGNLSTTEGAGKADVELRDPVPPVMTTPTDSSITSGMLAEVLRLTLHIKEMEV